MDDEWQSKITNLKWRKNNTELQMTDISFRNYWCDCEHLRAISAFTAKQFKQPVVGSLVVVVVVAVWYIAQHICDTTEFEFDIQYDAWWNRINHTKSKSVCHENKQTRSGKCVRRTETELTTNGYCVRKSAGKRRRRRRWRRKNNKNIHIKIRRLERFIRFALFTETNEKQQTLDQMKWRSTRISCALVVVG